MWFVSFEIKATKVRLGVLEFLEELTDLLGLMDGRGILEQIETLLDRNIT